MLSILALALWTAQASATNDCLAAPYTDTETEAQTDIVALLTRMAPAFESFPHLQQTLDNGRPRICLSEALVDARGYFDVARNRIVLRNSLSETEMATILVHELRHVGQLAEGHCPTDDLSMLENARAVFAMEADANAITALVAWTLRSQGDPGLWDALEGWEHYADIFAAFEAAIADGNSPAVASGRAFYQWYDSDWRRESYYIASCSDYLDRLDRTNALPRYQLLPEDFLDNLCHLPDGTDYPCDEPDFDLRPR